jgi:hypothetical protein
MATVSASAATRPSQELRVRVALRLKPVSESANYRLVDGAEDHIQQYNDKGEPVPNTAAAFGKFARSILLCTVPCKSATFL